MAKVIDITEKLNFESKPVIKVKDIEIEVNNNAATMLKVLPLLNDATPEAISEVCKNLFIGENLDKVLALDLDFKDFSTVVLEAVKLVAGDDDEGEAQTPATT
jgi:hypothetical protein